MDEIQKILNRAGRWLHRNRETIAKWFARTAVVIALPLAAIALFPMFLQLIAPQIDTKQDLYSVNRPVAFTFLDSSGREVGHRGAIVGKRLKLEDMPPYLPAAFIAMEDRRFYSHNGIDMRGLIRAMVTNFRAGHVVAGGSTITQQTAKIVYTSQERTVARKLSELMDAASLEKSLSKKQILELYLNRIYLGSGAYGVDGAAHVYFGKSAKDVTLAEAAMLATLTRAPSVFSPRRDLARAQTRAQIVLRVMYANGAVSRDDAQVAMNTPAVITDRTVTDARNYFFDTAADEARELLTRDGQTLNADLVVHTTLEPAIQDAARAAAVKTIRKKGRKAHASEAAVVVMKTDGAVSALVGGVDYEESTFNRVTQAHRQPGSSFKPFVYLAAVENGISPWDVRDDGAVDIDGWTPTNYGGRSFGTVTIAKALANSINTVTAGLAQDVGISTVVEAAQRVGISSPLEENASLALGTSEVTPIEMVSAYGAFANGGLRVRPYLVTQIDDTGGRVLFKRSPPQQQERVIADHVDKDMVAMLAGVVTSGTGRGAILPNHEAAGKTGTTQDYHDAWFIGFTHDYVAAVWVGNDDASPMKNVTGGSLPAEIWKATMTVAEKNLPSTPLDKSTPPAADAYSEGGTMYGDTEQGVSIDSGIDSGTSVAETPPPPEQGDRNTPGERRNFFDWLFGRGGNRQPAVPTSSPPPPPPGPPPPPPEDAPNPDDN